MTDSTFITLEYLKANSPIQNHVDGDLIRPFIVLCMDKYIEPICGTALYQKLINDVQNNTLSGSYLTLMQVYLQPTLVHYVQFEAMEFFASQITNKGVQNKNSDNSSPADDERIIRMEQKSYNNGAYYAQRAIQYLKANTSSFPEVVSPGSSADTIRPTFTQYFNGIHIPGIALCQYVRDSNGNIIYPTY